MGKVTIRLENTNELYLRETRVENLFINEYLPVAPGDYVRVYLLGLMCAQSGIAVDLDKMAHTLGLPVKEVEDAWSYWARKGIIRIFHTEGDGDYGVEYVSLIDQLYGKKRPTEEEPSKESKPDDAREAASDAGASREATDASGEDRQEMGTKEPTAREVSILLDEEESSAEKIARLIDEGIRQLYQEYEQHTGRLMSTREMEKMAEAVHVYNITPDVMSYAIKYCVELDKFNANYMIKVALRWTSEGCRNIGDVKEYLDKYSKRNADYNSIFKEIGFNRPASPAERELMSGWFDQMGFTLEEVLNACRLTAGIREPSLKYVNKILENKMLEAGGINVKRSYQNGSNSRGSSDRGAASSRPAPIGSDGSKKAKVSKAVLEEYYEYLRNEADKRQDARIDEVSSRYPEMRDLFEKENDLNEELMKMAFAPGAKEERARLKEERKSIEADKKNLLRQKGYPMDYLDKKYACRLCRDTGMTDDGLLCACREARAEEAYRWKTERNQ